MRKTRKSPRKRIEPHFSYNLLFEVRSVSRVLRTIRRQFLWKTSSKFSSAFWSAHASEPYLATVITVASNILILCPPLRDVDIEKEVEDFVRAVKEKHEKDRPVVLLQLPKRPVPSI
ncbi:uncharacterized protein LOC136028203 [Artemia franciscana]|uniref:uncharacterized protein LOC136028203 n=1 Tax=Artemia franciscana TaxID=6661 RepID=UPI0032DAB62B